MKLSERMNDYAIEDEKMTDNTIVKQWAEEVALLEEENEALRSYKEEVEQVADVMYQCTLRRLKNTTPEDTPISDIPASP